MAEKPLTFAAAASRFETKMLEHPFTFDGKTYESVTIRRMNAGEVETLVKSVAENPEISWFDYPMFDVPASVLREIDGDDGLQIKGAVNRFLPRLFRGAEETAQ